MKSSSKQILWWGRFDPDYSRNRIVRQCLREIGYQIVDFRPLVSSIGDVEAFFRNVQKPSAVWVPCFRHRDLSAASRWARRKQIPLVFDPLISAYDKQVLEKGRFEQLSHRARRLLERESCRFNSADLLIADTQEHARFFCNTFNLAPEKVVVLPVGAEESLFRPCSQAVKSHEEPLEVLFFGSFISLQAPQLIVEAARIYKGPPVRWRLVGCGPLYDECRSRASGLDNVFFEPWIDYVRLPEKISTADVILGIFGASEKASRVIPNKVFQGLACGRPLITRISTAYPEAMRGDRSGIEWVEPGSAESLAAAVAGLAQYPSRLPEMSIQARASYDMHFSMRSICLKLQSMLDQLLSTDRQGCDK